MALNIPDQYAPGLAEIASLPDAEIHAIVSSLQGSPPLLDVKSATALISSKTPSISNRELRNFLVALLSLYSLRAVRQLNTDDLVEEIIKAMRRSRKPELVLDAEKENRFRERLRMLLGFEALTTASKAVFLQHEHEHPFCHARIFTDARPIYSDDPNAPPSAMAISHMLKLAYHKGSRNDVEEIHIALDMSDLLKLKELIQRAESKAASLREVFESVQMPVIE
ncbi:MAG TPA: hypothetical protein VJ521_12285 [Acidobacteriota bacterium]|nr:hypothetical protein [Acidobacteriota bacterium]